MSTLARVPGHERQSNHFDAKDALRLARILLALVAFVSSVSCTGRHDNCDLLPHVHSVSITCDSNSYMMLEKGIVQRLYVVSLRATFAQNIDAIIYDHFLVDQQMESQRITDACFLLHSPPYRRLDQDESFDLLTIAQAICPEVELDPKPKHIRWIIGNDPVVIGLGVRTLPPNRVVNYGGMNMVGGRLVPTQSYRLVDTAAEDEQVSDLFVLPHWPSMEHAVGQGENSGAVLTRSLKSDVLHIHLKRPCTIEFLQQSKPWM